MAARVHKCDIREIALQALVSQDSQIPYQIFCSFSASQSGECMCPIYYYYYYYSVKRGKEYRIFIYLVFHYW